MRWLPLLLLLSACGDPATGARADAAAQAEALLASDASQALHVLRGALADHGPDPRLHLVAAQAHMHLDQPDDAIAQAEAGLAFEDLPADLRADLCWVRGAGLTARYRDLSVLDDWRLANSALEEATLAGRYRAEAAVTLALLQDLSPLGSPERQLRFARLALQVQPQGSLADKMRALLAAKGQTP